MNTQERQKIKRIKNAPRKTEHQKMQDRINTAKAKVARGEDAE